MNREQIHAFFDGELGPGEVARLEEALRSDPALAAELEQLRALDGALESLPGHEVPADFTARVLAAVRQRRRGLWMRLGAPLAAAAALALAVFLPRFDRSGAPEELFTTEEHLDYVWETDAGTFGSFALSELEDAILAELEVS
jgi:anti-sigma factor RsiW